MLSPKALSLLLFSTPTKAGTTSMQNSINSLSALFDFSANPNPSTLTSSSRPSNRTLVQVLTGPEYASVFQNIDHYGCWCYFEENFTKGKGQPQDPIDELCKVLHDGYECAIMDGEEDGYACAEPWLSDYSTSTVPASELQSDCKTRNQDPCAAHTCIVEGYFIRSIVSLFIGGTTHRSDILHSTGSFNPETECVAKNSAGNGGALGSSSDEKSCCGDYPFRHPFRTGSGQRACCGARTYEVGVFECCPDESVDVACS